MKTLYVELVEAGIEIGNHESDLYFPDTPQSRAILAKHTPERENARTFVNQAPPNKGQFWIDVPFAFIPWWEARCSRSNTTENHHA